MMTVYEGRSRRNRIIGITVAAAVVLLVLSRGCSFAGGPLSGRVIEVDTLRPIAGAIVVASWNGAAMGLVHSSRVCFHVETAISDADGRYRVSPWVQAPGVWAVWGSTTLVDAYLPGYESVRTQKTLTEAPDDVFMKKFDGTSVERFEYISQRVFGGMDCVNAESSARNLYPLLKVAFREAKSLANSAKETSELEGMRRIAAETWLAQPTDSPYDPRAIAKVPEDVRRDLE